MARKARAGACSSSERPGCGFTDGDTLRDNHAMNEIASPSAEQAQQDIAEEFALFGDWSERYQYLIEIAVPESPTEGIPVTYVPARNTVMLALALAWSEVLGARDIFIGVNAVDYSGY